MTELLGENIFSFLDGCNFLYCILSSIGCAELFSFCGGISGTLMPMTSKSFVFIYLMRGNLIKACAIFGWFNRFDRFYVDGCLGFFNVVLQVLFPEVFIVHCEKQIVLVVVHWLIEGRGKLALFSRKHILLPPSHPTPTSIISPLLIFLLPSTTTTTTILLFSLHH